jgi:hypothetical protein
MRSLRAPLRPGCLPRQKTRKAPLWVTLRRSTSRSPQVFLGWNSPEATTGYVFEKLLRALIPLSTETGRDSLLLYRPLADTRSRDPV